VNEQTEQEKNRHNKLRVSAIKLGVLAFAFYVGFIAIGALRG
jgi:hypothetical protein